MVHIPCVTNVSVRRAERADLAHSGRGGADRAGYGVAPVDDQERRVVGADLPGLALVVFDLATGAPVARDRGRLLPVEADLGSEGQDVRGVQTLWPCPKWARSTAVRRNKAAYDKTPTAATGTAP